MTNSLSVGLGEIKISRDPQDVLVAFGLGSCIGVGMYDPALHLGGLLHAVLPKKNDANESTFPKYVDSGTRLLLEQMVKAGGIKSRIILRIAGGANMLVSTSLSSSFDIGTRNIQAVKAVLSELNLKISGEDLGGQTGRTVRMYISSGRMTIRMMGGSEREF
jgi:chemotaxis protein CheD